MIPKRKKIRKEGRFQTVFFSVLIGVFLIGTISFLIVSNLRISNKRTDMIGDIEALQRDILLLEQTNANLRAGIRQTENEAYWEEKMREQGYKKPGEEAIVVLPSEEGTEGVVEEEKGFWERFLEKIGF